MRSRLICCAAVAMGLTAMAQSPTYSAAVEAAGDPALTALPGGVMLSIPGLYGDFVIAGGGQLVQLPNGTARLTGRVFSQASIFSAFWLDLVFAGIVSPGTANHPPPGSPHALLDPGAYAPAGPVDPATWTYYRTATGTLTGTHFYDGAVVDVQLSVLAMQVGDGANNRNGGRGLEAELLLTVVRQPAVPLPALSTATLWCDLPPHRADRATHPEADPTRSAVPDRALSLPGIADDYLLVPPGVFTEFEDGHAELTGRFARLAQLDDAWTLTLQLLQRVDPGEAGHPPAGSPVLQMLPGAYTSLGGTVDPGHWHYYRAASGTLTGEGSNAGGAIALVQQTAVQVGSGANQANTFGGFHGVLQGTVTSQPTGHTIALGGAVELAGVAERIPVLPLPSLTAPATPHTLPTLTEQGILLQGDNLAWADYVAVGPSLVPAGDEGRWLLGWFELVDNRHIELHAPQGLAPGVYDVRVQTPAYVTNVLPLTLTHPTVPTLRAESAVGAPDTLHVRMHRGALAPALTMLATSSVLSPTTFPGYVSLSIGLQNQALLVVPLAFFHDPVTGIAAMDLGPLPPWFTGFTWHFQAATLDLATQQLPMTATNVWAVAF